ncbi:MAG: NAD(P)H-hydrate dehydratase [Cyanobacteria bacterium P01_H01_bin.74]
MNAPALLLSTLQQIEAQAEIDLGLSPEILMQNAGQALLKPIFNALLKRNRLSTPGMILCGPGNNGGDGLTVAAMLCDLFAEQGIGFSLTVVYSGVYSGSGVEKGLTTAKSALEALKNLASVKSVKMINTDALQPRDETSKLEDCVDICIQEAGWVIDALFGFGLNRPLEKNTVYYRIIAALNARQVHQQMTQMTHSAQYMAQQQKHLALTNQKAESVDTRPVVFSIDCPSGLSPETGQPLGIAVQAHITYALTCEKPGLVIQPGRAYAGDVQVLDIGIPQDYLTQTVQALHAASTPLQGNACFKLSAASFDCLWTQKTVTQHKITNGHLLILAGCQSMPGAAALSVHAALQTGLGLVTLAAPSSVFRLYPFPPEIIRLELPDDAYLNHASLVFLRKHFSALFHPATVNSPSDQKTGALKKRPYQAVLVGPGLLSEEEGTLVELCSLLSDFPLIKVADAEVLNALASLPETENQNLQLDEQWIITPHVGECTRLLKETTTTINQNLIAAACKTRKKMNATVVLKSATTVIASHPIGQSPVSVSCSPVGNAGMAKAGMGDVLAGIIAAVAAQLYSPQTGIIKPAEICKAAAELGVFWHGIAGNWAATVKPMQCLTASDVVAALPDTLKALLVKP